MHTPFQFIGSVIKGNVHRGYKVTSALGTTCARPLDRIDRTANYVENLAESSSHNRIAPTLEPNQSVLISCSSVN